MVIAAVEKQATADSARSICWLYFVENEDPLLDAALRHRGYASVVVDAECYLPIPWERFDDYLSSFRAEYRGMIRHEMAVFDDAGVEVELHDAKALGVELAALERQWRVKYGRTPPLEEILADYEELRSYLASSLRVFVARLGGRPIGFTVFLQDGDTWYARFGGFDYSAGNLFLYFNLLFYRPIQTLVECGARCVHYAQKSHEAKRSRGCLLRNVLAYVRLPEGWSHVGATLELIDDAERRRLASIASRRILRDPH
jgi:predicted N-acyltransferase